MFRKTGLKATGASVAADALDLPTIQPRKAERSGSTVRLIVSVRPFLGPLRTRVVRTERELLIGRDPRASVVVRGDLVSRHHAIVRVLHETLEVEDLSAYGTLVDGRPLLRARLRVARQCDLVVGCNHINVRLLRVADQT